MLWWLTPKPMRSPRKSTGAHDFSDGGPSDLLECGDQARRPLAEADGAGGANLSVDHRWRVRLSSRAGEAHS